MTYRGILRAYGVETVHQSGGIAIWLLLLLAALVIMIPSWLTEPNWIEYATLGVVALAGSIEGFRRLRRLIEARQLFTAEFQPTSDTHLKAIEVTELGQHNLKLTLRLAVQTYVEFVSLRWEGEGRRPEIRALYDWQHGFGRRQKEVDSYPIEDGTWYWRYNPPFRRDRKARITIGIETVISDRFSGNLRIAMTTFDGSKWVSLAFAALVG